MIELAEHLKNKGKKPYIIAMGASMPQSLWAYVDAWAEMLKQPFFDEITDIWATWASGGSILELAVANYWTGSKKRIHGVPIYPLVDSTELKDNPNYFVDDAKKVLSHAGLSNVPIGELIDIVEGYNRSYKTWPEISQGHMAINES